MLKLTMLRVLACVETRGVHVSRTVHLYTGSLQCNYLSSFLIAFASPLNCRKQIQISNELPAGDAITNRILFCGCPQDQTPIHFVKFGLDRSINSLNSAPSFDGK